MRWTFPKLALVTAGGLMGCSNTESVPLDFPEDGRSALVVVERGPDSSASIVVRFAAIDLESKDGLEELLLNPIAEDERVTYTVAAYDQRLADLGLEAGPLDREAQGVLTDRFDRYLRNQAKVRSVSVVNGVASNWAELSAAPDHLKLAVARPDFCEELHLQRFTFEGNPTDVSAAVSTPRKTVLTGHTSQMFEVSWHDDTLDMQPVEPMDEQGMPIASVPAWSGQLDPGSEQSLWTNREGRLFGASLEGDHWEFRARTATVAGAPLYWMSVADDVVGLQLNGRILRGEGRSPAEWETAATVLPYGLPGQPSLRYARGGIARDADGSAVVASGLRSVHRIQGRQVVEITEVEPALQSTEGFTTAAYVEGWGLLVGSSFGGVYELVEGRLLERVRVSTHNIINVIAPFTGDRVFLSGVDGFIAVLERSDTDAFVLRECSLHGDHTVRFMTPIGEGAWLLSGVRRDTSPHIITVLTPK